MQQNSRNVPQKFGSIMFFLFFFFGKVVGKITNDCLDSTQDGSVGGSMDPWAKARFDPGPGR